MEKEGSERKGRDGRAARRKAEGITMRGSGKERWAEGRSEG